jgi:tetratricopeptide (TPR) repeat protein
MLKAKNCIADHRLRDAIKILEEGLRIHGDVAEFTELLAHAHLLMEDDELAAFYFEQTAGLSDLHYHCHLKAAEIYEKMKDYEQALSCYQLYLDILPEDNEVQIKYANVLRCNGQRGKALEILIRYAGESVEICNQVAALFFDSGNYVQARNRYLSALTMDKNNLPALRGLWGIGLLFGDWDVLFEVGAKLLILGEESLNGLSVSDIVDAIRLFRERLNELRNINLKFEKVTLPLFVAEVVESDFVVPVASGVTPQGINTASLRATKQEKIAALKDSAGKARLRGDYGEAIAILWKMLSMDDGNAGFWAELTECLRKTNQNDVAEMAIQEAIKFNPKCVDFYMTYLDIVLCTHSSADYVRLLKDVKRRFPGDPEIRLRWANAQEIYIGDALGAKHSYEKFLNLAPVDHPEILKVKHFLQIYAKEKNDEKK